MLQDMLLRAGFPAPRAQHAIDFGIPHGTTTPDFFYEDPNDRYEGLCIYLDGLGAGSHGNPEAERRDMRIRAHLRDEGYEVIAIAASDLVDRNAMATHLSRLARLLDGKERAREVKADTRWFMPAETPAPGDDG